jgi:hypothetical protein
MRTAPFIPDPVITTVLRFLPHRATSGQQKVGPLLGLIGGGSKQSERLERGRVRPIDQVITVCCGLDYKTRPPRPQSVTPPQDSRAAWGGSTEAESGTIIFMFELVEPIDRDHHVYKIIVKSREKTDLGRMKPILI